MTTHHEAPSPLGTGVFWAEVLERAGRQAAQTAIPIITVVAATGNGGLDFWAVGIALVVAVTVTVLKAIAGLSATADQPWAWQLLDRAAPAAAGTALGLIPVNAVDIATANWLQVGYACVAAALLAVLAYYVTPPTRSTGRHVATNLTTPSQSPGVVNLSG